MYLNMNMNVNGTRHIIFIYILKASNMGSEFQRRWACYDLTNGRDRQNDGNVNGGKCMENVWNMYGTCMENVWIF